MSHIVVSVAICSGLCTLVGYTLYWLIKTDEARVPKRACFASFGVVTLEFVASHYLFSFAPYVMQGG